mmetsp:Transcript_113272/g.199961  ORF Transcript_113272/g.199961 Transcript_113272/m.199961 type:complete len:117 (-) Transcript_113272:567-917(-)
MQVFQLHQADGHPKVAMHLLADGQLEVLGTAPNGVEVQSTGLRTGDYTQVLIPVYVKDRNLRLASRVSGAASSVRQWQRQCRLPVTITARGPDETSAQLPSSCFRSSCTQPHGGRE